MTSRMTTFVQTSFVLFTLAIVARAGNLDSSLALAPAGGEPGEIVDVPLLGTYGLPLWGMGGYASYDNDRLEYLGYVTDGTLGENLDPLALFHHHWEPGIGGFGFSSERQTHRDDRIPPASGEAIGKLRFRVRANAPSGSAEVEVLATYDGRGTSLSLDRDGLPTASTPELSGSSVAVSDPSGPRPVGDLDCSQYLDVIRLAFTPTDAYDSIEIERNGETVATLPGDATSYSEPVEELTTITYGVVASSGGETSITIECELSATEPQVPAVQNLECRSGRVTWTNPVDYDRLSLFKNGDIAAELTQIATSWIDRDADGELAVYTIITELSGYRSPEVSCIDNGLWALEVGDVQVPLSATRIRVPIYATTARTCFGFEVYADVPLDRLDLVQDDVASIEHTVLHPDTEYSPIGIGALHVPSAGIIFDFFPPIEPEKNLPPGLRQHVFDFVFDVTGEFADGETFDVPLVDGAFVYPTGQTTHAMHIGGQIRFGSSGVGQVENLEAHVVAGGGAEGVGGGAAVGDAVQLSWRNASSYDRISIIRNGEPVSEIAGDATSFIESDVPPGVFTYKVVGHAAGKSSFPASALVTTVLPKGAFLRGDANRDGVVDIADPIRTLGKLFVGAGELPCRDAADADDSGELDISDAVYTVNFLFLGGRVIRSPGTRHPWFDPTEDVLGCAE